VLSKQGYELVEESLAILQQLNHPEALVFAYDSLIVNIFFQNRNTEYIEAINKMLKISTEIGDKWLFAFTLFGASLGALSQEDYAEARRLAEYNLNLNEEIGDVIGSTIPLFVLGHVAFARGENEEAKGFYLRCLKISEEVRFHYAIQTSSKYLGKVAISMGEIAEAEEYLVQSLIISKEIGFVRDIINLIYEFARLWVAQDNSEQAVELLAFVLQHPASYESRLLEGRIRDSAKELLTKLEDELSQETYSAALERGQELEVEVIVADLISSKR
jgi:tetratricopeptide (TPR) repeat protein